MGTVCASKGLKKLQNFEGSHCLSPDLREKKQPTYKNSKERSIAIASVLGLDNLSSYLWIMILGFITKLIFKYESFVIIYHIYRSMY